MYKQEFLDGLKKKLSGLPREEIEERLRFYSEMIDDSVEEGLSEEQAVARLADIDEATDLGDHPEARASVKRRSGWASALIIIGSPIWFSLLISALAVVFSLLVALWSIIVSLWSVLGALIGGGLGGVLGGVGLIVMGHAPTGVALLGAGVSLLGLGIFAFFGCKAVTRVACRLSVMIPRAIGACFGRKEKGHD